MKSRPLSAILYQPKDQDEANMAQKTANIIYGNALREMRSCSG